MYINNDDVILTDSSRLITAALAEAGADVFVGYPITPANLIYYYASKRFPTFMAAPDEITTIQWMTGFSAVGRLPITATSFPGYALMIEGINMAYMMELPMVIIFVQRLGPATGSATRGAQGDVALLSGSISGGMAIPSFSISNTADCWNLPPKALEVAVKLRTPVIIFTSKEEVMTTFSIKREILHNIERIPREQYNKSDTYIPYEFDEKLVPSFLSLAQTSHQVRFTASTHDKKGIIQNATTEALENSMRLHWKIVNNLESYTYYELDEQPGANVLLLSFGITSQAGREAVKTLRSEGKQVSHLIAKTLLPVPQEYYEICKKYKSVVVAEENLSGQYRQLLFGSKPESHISGVNAFGKMVNPGMIIKEITK
ncbi:MAG: hypothetical protein WC868_11745 [Bacteroidales bacterium]